MWGSAWAIATHAGVNPLCFCCCDQDNPGGRQFYDSASSTKRTRANIHALVRPRVVRDEERILPVSARQHDTIRVVNEPSSLPALRLLNEESAGIALPVPKNAFVAGGEGFKGSAALVDLNEFDYMELFLLLIAAQEEE